ncbi:hypothetical protein CYY_006023 [Polysphondylium violaceum]|uniref:F-box domain-containing protein n=1 Tax=Polysphondylium violaceum TaxID=133409 RepID=A0A8J4PR48_9MYCE|nr:hypothetical protein CYY_006023 [Polysphondylium violaceum]
MFNKIVPLLFNKSKSKETTTTTTNTTTTTTTTTTNINNNIDTRSNSNSNGSIINIVTTSSSNNNNTSNNNNSNNNSGTSFKKDYRIRKDTLVEEIDFLVHQIKNQSIESLGEGQLVISDQILSLEREKSKFINMSAKLNYSSPNTLIPSVSKTFISPFGLSVSPQNNNNMDINSSNNNNNNKQSIQDKNFGLLDNNNGNQMQIQHQPNYHHHKEQLDIFSIPTEMLVHLLSFLSARDLWNISQTCKRIWYTVDTFKFWENLFERTCPRIFYAMQFNSRWSSPNSHQFKMILCYIDSLPDEYNKSFDQTDENGQIKKIIGVIKENLHNPSVLRETCYILKRLSYRQRKEDEHERLIARYGGIKLILQTMKKHPYDAGVQEDACGALGNLTCDSPNNFGVYSNNNYLEVVEQGGIQLILLAMKNHMLNPGVQYNTSFVLRNLARNDISESRVAQEGGIQLIATAMRNHPNHIGIQTQGCGALRNLGCNDSNKILSAKEGGIGLILKAMKGFSSHSDLQLNGCGALRNLARNEENKNMIAKQGGIQLVLLAMNNHQDDPDVQDEGCAALINLAYQDEINEETIAREGGITLILNAMRNHPFHSGVQMQGRGALKNLSCNPKNKLTIARSGGIELMEIAIQNHPTFANRFLELMRILQAALEENAF